MSMGDTNRLLGFLNIIIHIQFWYSRAAGKQMAASKRIPNIARLKFILMIRNIHDVFVFDSILAWNKLNFSLWDFLSVPIQLNGFFSRSESHSRRDNRVSDSGPNITLEGIFGGRVTSGTKSIKKFKPQNLSNWSTF